MLNMYSTANKKRRMKTKTWYVYKLLCCYICFQLLSDCVPQWLLRSIQLVLYVHTFPKISSQEFSIKNSIYLWVSSLFNAHSHFELSERSSYCITEKLSVMLVEILYNVHNATVSVIFVSSWNAELSTPSVFCFSVFIFFLWSWGFLFS